MTVTVQKDPTPKPSVPTAPPAVRPQTQPAAGPSATTETAGGFGTPQYIFNPPTLGTTYPTATLALPQASSFLQNTVQLAEDYSYRRRFYNTDGRKVKRTTRQQRENICSTLDRLRRAGESPGTSHKAYNTTYRSSTVHSTEREYSLRGHPFYNKIDRASTSNPYQSPFESDSD